jgi:hypothetical protein
MLGEGIACQLDEFRIDFVGKCREETIAGILSSPVTASCLR